MCHGLGGDSHLGGTESVPQTTVGPVSAAHTFPVLPLPPLPSDPVVVKLRSPQKGTEAKLSAKYGLDRTERSSPGDPGEARQPRGGDKARSRRRK